jgi:hypothetical protein
VNKQLTIWLGQKNVHVVQRENNVHFKWIKMAELKLDYKSVGIILIEIFLKNSLEKTSY